MNSSYMQQPVGLSPGESSALIIEAVVEQHAEEAAFLWTTRERAVHASHYSLKDLSGLDERVEAHLDGLRIAGQFGWQLCEQVLDNEEAGKLFTAAVLAFDSGDTGRMHRVLEKGGCAPELERELI